MAAAAVVVGVASAASAPTAAAAAGVDHRSARAALADTSPPGPVRNLTWTSTTTQIILTWTNPSDPDFTGAVVRRSAANSGVAPSSPTSGSPVSTTGVPTAPGARVSLTQSSLTAKTQYTYAVFSRDSSGNYSSAAIASAITKSTSGPGLIAQTSALNVKADRLPTVQINGVVWSQVIIGNTVYAGGDFSKARPAGSPPGTNEVPRTNLLAYDLTTGTLISSFAPVLNGKVDVVAATPDGTRLFVGGSFTSVNGKTHNRIAAFDTASGALVDTFTAGANAAIKAMAVTSSTLYVGGLFTAVNGKARSRLAAFQISTGALTAWAPVADGYVQALVLAPGGTSTLVVGGAFATLNGVTVRGIGAVSTSTGASVNWITNKTVYAYGSGAGFLSLSTDGYAIYGTAWNYRGTGNLEGTFAARPTDGAIIWVEDCHGDTYSNFAVNGTVYTVSHAHYCATLGGWTDNTKKKHTVAFTAQPTGTLLHDTTGYPDHYGLPAPSIVDWFPDMAIGTFTGQNQAAWTVTGNAKYIVEGGEFLSVNGTPQQGLVRFAIKPISPAKQGPRLSSTGWPPKATVTSSTSVRVSIGANWDRDDKTLSYKLLRNGATVATRTVDSVWWSLPTWTVDDTGLTRGTTYSYKVVATDGDGNSASSATVSVTPS